MNSINNNVVLTDVRSTIHEIYSFYKGYTPKLSTHIIPIIGGIAIAIVATIIMVMYF
ncbi:MAG: hypothetical protein GF311_01670 [Candidatus Lokiarchaeota archaeon]|nr:hypothetical protein [Candidatus Lokiarchaeota archaeon]